MPLIASENYTQKRIYLSIDSVGVDVQPMDIYTEHRARRRLNASGQRKFRPMVRALGKQQIGPKKFTPRFVNLAAGVRIVPYDTTHNLLIIGALISTADSLEGRDLFDRSSLVASVDIDYQPPQVEIITVNTGGGLDAGQAAQLTAVDLRIEELYQRQGLKAGVTATVVDPTVGTPGSLVVRDGATVVISQTLTKPDEDTTTISRNA